MLNNFIDIILGSLKLDKNLYKNQANYSELGIYYSLIIVVISIIIQTIPNNVYIDWMSEKGLWLRQDPLNFRNLLFLSLIIWILKSFCIFVVGVKIFPNRDTKCNFLKVLITVGYAHSPLLLNFLVFNSQLLYGLLFTYIWYVSTLVIGINEILSYKSNFKSFLISFVSPIAISLVVFIIITFM